MRSSTFVVAAILAFAPACGSGDAPATKDTSKKGQAATGTGGSRPAPGAGSMIRPSNVTWTAPDSFVLVQSPTQMRLATYKVGQDAELSITQVGGTAKANVDRWKGMFSEPTEREKTETTVGDLKVTEIWFEGTYSGMATPGAGASGPQEGYALLGAVVEWPGHGDPHFFKLTGPKATVEGARAAFEEMIQSLAPEG